MQRNKFATETKLTNDKSLNVQNGKLRENGEKSKDFKKFFLDFKRALKFGS